MKTSSPQVLSMPPRETPAAAPAPLAKTMRPVRFDPHAIDRARVCEQIDQSAGNSLAQALDDVRRRDPSLPSAATLRRWYAVWKQGGAGALLSKRSGRQRKPYGWEARAVDLYSSKTRPAAATVARWLRAEGYPDATDSRVLRYLQSLPETVGGENSPKRAGWHYYSQNFGPYARRDTSAIDVGLIYQGDGHTCDEYVRHPSSGGHFRPELTIWIDVRSNHVAGFWLSEAESAVSTLHGLSRTLLIQDHVPAALHVDPGSGFINRLLLDESLGWLTRLGIDVITEKPGNAKGKGLVEGWFRWFEERMGKRFSSYCGHCRTDDDIRRLERSMRTGRVTLPLLHDYAAAVEEYIESYNRTPQRRLGCAPADIWKGLKRNPVGISEDVLLRPTTERVSRRGAVEMFNRVYRARELLLLDGRTVEIEYDLVNDSHVWINYDGRRVCQAELSQRRAWAETSIVEDLRAKRERGQLKRLQKHAEEITAKARPVIDAEATAYAAELVAPDPRLPETKDDFADYL